MGERRGEGWALFLLGAAALDHGDFAVSQTFCQESVAILHAVEDKEGQARSLRGLAAAMLYQRHALHAARLFAAAAAAGENLGVLFSPREQKVYEQHVSRVRTVLGEAAFANTWKEGFALAGESAATYTAAILP